MSEALQLERIRALGRVLGDYDLGEPGPLLIVVGGLHGNEPAGVHAARRVLEELAQRRPRLRGRVVALIGNRGGLEAGRRYVERDLNRVWTESEVERVRARAPDAPAGIEAAEQRELLEAIEREVGARAWERVILLDLHSTSADAAPFTIMSDTLQNRPFAFALPIPVILGLEERVPGTLLSWFAGRGHVALCVEGGRSDLPSTVDHHESALWLAMVAGGLVRPSDVPRLDALRARLAERAHDLPRVVELRHRQGIAPGEPFRMLPGFQSFQWVRRGDLLAHGGPGGGLEIRAPRDGLLLMPLYQGLGEDGFFLGRPVRRAWLSLSALLRRSRLQGALPLFPGVRRDPVDPEVLLVDRAIARLWPVELLHLFGYRRRLGEDRVLVFVRRPDRP